MDVALLRPALQPADLSGPIVIAGHNSRLATGGGGEACPGASGKGTVRSLHRRRGIVGTALRHLGPGLAGEGIKGGKPSAGEAFAGLTVDGIEKAGEVRHARGSLLGPRKRVHSKKLRRQPRTGGRRPEVRNHVLTSGQPTWPSGFTVSSAGIVETTLQ